MVKVVSNDAGFQSELKNAAGKLVVADFFATWCGPCQHIAPFYEQLSNKYPQAVFLKIDVDQCQTTAQAQGVSAMPTFMFYVKEVKVDSLRGADPAQLEAKVKHWYESVPAGDVDNSVPGQVDLLTFVCKKDCECLNESDSHKLGDCINTPNVGGWLESDCDEQLIMRLPFNQPVKIHSIKLKGSATHGPKTLKLFINQPAMLDFDQATAMEPTQLLDLTEQQVVNAEPVNLRYVKFQNVQNITIFVQDNLGGADTSRIEVLKLYGSPLTVTKMDDFKRVAGKKGEGH